MLLRINPSTGVVVYTNSYDVFGIGACCGGLSAVNLYNDLVASAGFLVIVYTYDEPDDNRMTANLPSAIYNCGGSAGIFGKTSSNDYFPPYQPNTFYWRSAYILAGVCGRGAGSGLEYYSGYADMNANSWLVKTVQYNPTTQALYSTLTAGGTGNVCNNCPTGSSSGSGMATCTCGAGYYSNGGSGTSLVCTPCAAGSYNSGSGATSCTTGRHIVKIKYSNIIFIYIWIYNYYIFFQISIYIWL